MATFRCNFCHTQLVADVKPPPVDRWCGDCREPMLQPGTPQAAMDEAVRQGGLRHAAMGVSYDALNRRHPKPSKPATKKRKARKKPAVRKTA